MRSLSSLAATMMLSLVMGSPLLAHPAETPLEIGSEAVTRDLVTPPPMPAASASGLAPTDVPHTRVGRFYHTTEGVDVGDRAMMFDAGGTMPSEAKKAAPTSVTWISAKDWLAGKKIDPSKPTWIHYSRPTNCEPCRRAEARLRDKEVAYQSQFWNCVWIDATDMTVPADEFDVALNDAVRLGARESSSTGCLSSGKAYARLLYGAWKEMKGMK